MPTKTSLLICTAHHALVKGVLFLGVGASENETRRTVIIIELTIAALALAGAPMTSGLAAKLSLKEVFTSYPELIKLISVSTVGTTLLMARFIFILIKSRPHLHSGSLLPLLWFFLFAIMIATPWFWPFTRSFMVQSIIPAVLMKNFSPIIIGSFAASLFYLLTRNRDKPIFSLPEGDIVVLVEKTSRLLQDTLDKFFTRLNSKIQRMEKHRANLVGYTKGFNSAQVESFFSRWPTVGMFYLAVIITFFILFFFAQLIIR